LPPFVHGSLFIVHRSLFILPFYAQYGDHPPPCQVLKYCRKLYAIGHKLFAISQISLVCPSPF
jgi:hypothetical protein